MWPRMHLLDLQGLDRWLDNCILPSCAISIASITHATIALSVMLWIPLQLRNMLNSTALSPGWCTLPLAMLCVTGLRKSLVWDFFSENRVWCMVDKPCHRATSCSSPRPIARFAEELQHFVCDRTTPPIIEKLGSKGRVSTPTNWSWPLGLSSDCPHKVT